MKSALTEPENIAVPRLLLYHAFDSGFADRRSAPLPMWTMPRAQMAEDE